MRFRICFSVILAVLSAVIFTHISQSHNDNDFKTGQLMVGPRPNPDCVITDIVSPKTGFLDVSIFCTDGIKPVDSDFYLTCACPDGKGNSCISDYMNADGVPFIVFERPSDCVESIVDHNVGRQTIRINGTCDKKWVCITEAQ